MLPKGCNKILPCPCAFSAFLAEGISAAAADLPVGIVKNSQDKQGSRDSSSGFILFAVFLVKPPQKAAAVLELLLFVVLGELL